jgi:hypothetical protein
MALPSACPYPSCMLLWGHVACTPPPHTCDLNPNELAQATVRRYITHCTKTVYKPAAAILWQQVPPHCCFLSFRLHYAMSQNSNLNSV